MDFTGERFMPGETGEIVLEHLNRYFFVINQIDLKNKIVLDIASGEGYGSNLLAQHADSVYGVDISLEAIEHARSKYNRNNLIYIEGNATSIPLSDHTVDVVVSFETIEHHDKHHEMIKEIKRVLKPAGTVIISSPDKLNYSDKPMYKNEYHIKELYYDEFKDLIKEYFKKTIFYSQKIFVGSMIALDENIQEYKKPIVIDKYGNSSEFTPLYNIAIATDNVNFNPNQQMVLYNETYTYVTREDIDHVRQSIHRSYSYRVGRFILTPLRIIRVFFSKSMSNKSSK